MLRHRWSRQRSLTWEFRLHTGPGGCPLIGYKESSSCPPPTTRKQLQAFLGLTGYCRIWIPNYGLIAQTLYESLKGRDDSIPLMWGTPQKEAEATLKQALTQASALRLPDPEKACLIFLFCYLPLVSYPRNYYQTKCCKSFLLCCLQRILLF